jgi:hypothetical protein
MAAGDHEDREPLDDNVVIIPSVDELRTICAQLLTHLESVVDNAVPLRWDMFWAIPTGERYNGTHEPTTFTVGQLSESWKRLRALDDSTVTSYALVWLADVLRAIGETVVR